MISPRLKYRLIQAQRSEITEEQVYRQLARWVPDDGNRRVLEQIADDERSHYEFWEQYTGERPAPRAFQGWLFTFIARVFGLTFGIKLMEKMEERAQSEYSRVSEVIPDAERILREEDEHEHELLNIIDEERLQYIGSVVLGLNDALVELTGALAGYTLALQDNRRIALVGLITGIAAAMSMAASEYLSTKSEAAGKTPGKAAAYTGSAYICTVLLLVLPFLLLNTPLPALAITLGLALLIIFAFTFYISVARDLPFTHRFAEMAGLSLAVAAVSFGVGYVLSGFFGIEP